MFNKEMQVRLSVIILSISLVLVSFTTNKRLVFIESVGKYDGFIYNETTNSVNLYIDRTIIPDSRLQKGIKMYLAYQFVQNKNSLAKAFVKEYHISLSKFASLHRKQICKVVCYLESSDHGNLPLIYNRQAYDLLEIKELKPNITAVKERLEKGGMLLIDAVEDGTGTIRLDSTTSPDKRD